MRRLTAVKKYFYLSLEMIKANIMTAMEYRLSFFIHVFGMLLNDIGLILVWVIFFIRFPAVNGWQFPDLALLYAVMSISFSVMMIFGGGMRHLAKLIANGELDYFLALPKNVLWHVGVSKTEISAIGDLLFGLVIFFFSGNLSIEKFALVILAAVCGGAIFLNYVIITQSLSFYFGNFETAATEFFEAVIGFSLYPQSVYHGVLKILMLTIIPAFFTITLPVEMVRNFSWPSLLYLIGFYILTFIIAQLVFRFGLKRYESGNLISVKL